MGSPHVHTTLGPVGGLESRRVVVGTKAPAESRPCQQQPDTFWATEFVAGSTQQVNRKLGPVRTPLTENLGCIHMEWNSPLLASQSHCVDGLQGAHFALAPDQRDEHCWRSQE